MTPPFPVTNQAHPFFEAKKRMQSTQFGSWVAPSDATHTGKTAEMVARAVGVSPRTVEFVPLLQLQRQVTLMLARLLRG